MRINSDNTWNVNTWILSTSYRKNLFQKETKMHVQQVFSNVIRKFKEDGNQINQSIWNGH